MRKEVIMKDSLGNVVIDAAAVESLKSNGTYLPDVDKVLFNLKTEGRRRVEAEADGEKPKYETYNLKNPVLTTKVWWADGTTTTVQNSEHDPVQVEEVDVGGQKVKVATACSKEIGVAMAAVKRTCGRPDGKGELTDTGFGRILRQIVESAYDQPLEAAKAAKAKADAKAAKAKRKAEAAAKPKRKTPTDAEFRRKIWEFLDEYMSKDKEPGS